LYEELSNVDNAMNTNQILILKKDNFVPLLYYRRLLVNNIRKKYEKDNNIHYDWVIASRIFDTKYDKKNPLDFLYKPPNIDTIYCSIDNMTMGNPEITNKIYEDLGNYPVVGYEQWNDEEFKKEYLKIDNGIYFIRSCSSLCSENQMMWACLKSCNNCIQIKLTGYEDNAYLHYETCPNRL
jgi:hypothetical protein